MDHKWFLSRCVYCISFCLKSVFHSAPISLYVGYFHCFSLRPCHLYLLSVYLSSVHLSLSLPFSFLVLSFPCSPVCLHCLPRLTCVSTVKVKRKDCAYSTCVCVFTFFSLSDEDPCAWNATCRGGKFTQGSFFFPKWVLFLLHLSASLPPITVHLYPLEISLLSLTVSYHIGLSVCPSHCHFFLFRTQPTLPVTHKHTHTNSYTYLCHCYSWEEQAGLAVGWFMSMNSVTPSLPLHYTKLVDPQPGSHTAVKIAEEKVIVSINKMYIYIHRKCNCPTL